MAGIQSQKSALTGIKPGPPSFPCWCVPNWRFKDRKISLHNNFTRQENQNNETVHSMPLSDHPSLISGTYLLLLLQLQLLRKQTFTPKPNFFCKIEKFYQKKSWGVSFLVYLDILHPKPPFFPLKVGREAKFTPIFWQNVFFSKIWIEKLSFYCIFLISVKNWRRKSMLRMYKFCFFPP